MRKSGNLARFSAGFGVREPRFVCACRCAWMGAGLAFDPGTWLAVVLFFVPAVCAWMFVPAFTFALCGTVDPGTKLSPGPEAGVFSAVRAARAARSLSRPS